MSHTCPTCKGHRYTTVMVGKIVSGPGFWFRDDHHRVPHHFPCDVCRGTGTVDCLTCLDYGETFGRDQDGEAEWVPCPECERGATVATGISASLALIGAGVA